MKKLWVWMLFTSAVLLAGCGNNKVEMSFDDAHHQFNNQMFSSLVDAQQTLNSFDFMEWIQKIEVKGWNNVMDWVLNFRNEFFWTSEKASGVVNIELNAEDSESQFKIDAKWKLDMVILKDILYFNVSDFILDTWEENGLWEMVMQFVDQLKNQWMFLDPTTYMSWVNSLPKWLSANSIWDSQAYLADMQKLFDENNLFVQSWDVREMDGKVAYDLKFNVVGIQAIIDWFMANEQTEGFVLANNPWMTMEEMKSGLDGIPAALSWLELQAYLKVIDTDNVELVIDRLGLPEDKAGIVNSTIWVKKVDISLLDEMWDLFIKVDGKSDWIHISNLRGDDTLFDVVVKWSTDSSDDQVQFNINIKVTAFDLYPLATVGNPLNISLDYDYLLKRSSEKEIIVPSDAVDFAQVMSGMQSLVAPQPWYMWDFPEWFDETGFDPSLWWYDEI